MKLQTALFGAAILGCLAFALPSQDSKQDETAKKIDALTKALEIQTRRTSELAARVDRIESWLLTVRTASALLDGAADEARRNGFESAGPNPAARTNVLEGMKGFAAEISRGIPVPSLRPIPIEGR
jgi:hypothetical protein